MHRQPPIEHVQLVSEGARRERFDPLLLSTPIEDKNIATLRLIVRARTIHQR